MSDERIFRTIIHALRHDPWKYGLELDEEGFASIQDIVTGLRFDRYDWALLPFAEVERVVRVFGAGRLERDGSRIRACYGHSIELGRLPPSETPPALLFHGTSEEALPAILQNGLKPMGRRFVHLTSDQQYAVHIANSKDGMNVLIIDAARAHAAGMVFLHANAHVWLVEQVEAAYCRLG